MKSEESARKEAMLLAKTPPPGSPEAQTSGCTCPVLDNSHGKGYYGQSGLYVYTCDCPVHVPELVKRGRLASEVHIHEVTP